jgi:enamine deaminase RidA (YjgF/YER057c/UK114 family)
MTRTHAALALALLVVAASPAFSQQPATPEKQKVVGVHASIGYSDAIQVGNTVYVSGIVGRGETVEEQLTSIFTSANHVLAKFGATLADVVKETAYTTDMEALKAANPARIRAYGTHAPAATWVQIQRLFMESAKLEIDFIVVPGSGASR